jgi:hypothetical protein
VNVCTLDDENENDETDGETVPDGALDPAEGRSTAGVHPAMRRNAERHDTKTKERGLMKKRPFP